MATLIAVNAQSDLTIIVAIAFFRAVPRGTLFRSVSGVRHCPSPDPVFAKWPAGWPRDLKSWRGAQP